MGYTTQIVCMGNLIKGDLSSHLVLDMSYTTVGEDVPLDLQFSEDFSSAKTSGLLLHRP